MTLARCPDPLPKDLVGQIEALASFWAAHPTRPRLPTQAIASWDALVREWADELSLPLLIRKVGRDTVRGKILEHQSGRELVCTDNSPAAWLYMQADAGLRMAPTDVRDALASDRIPMAMVMDSRMREEARYRCSRISGPSPNVLGWKLCHKRQVRLRGRGPVETRPIELLREHFIDFLSPSNMFLVPLNLGGLGELQEFIAAIG